METQQINTTEQVAGLNWLNEENKNIEKNRQVIDKIDGLILEDGKLTTFEIIVGDKPFERWNDTTDENNVITKVIIPVQKDEKRFNFWLNLKNPTYHEIIKRLNNGQRKFTILRTGKMKATRYQIVE